MRPALLSIIAGLSAITPLTAQTAPAWRYAAPGSISSFRVTPLGIVLVAEEHRLVALEPDSGAVLWTRADLRNPAPHSYVTVGRRPFVVLGADGGVELIDLLTGTPRWQAHLPPELRPYLPLPEHGLLLAYGSTAAAKHVFVALELEDGTVRWEQPQPFDPRPDEKCDLSPLLPFPVVLCPAAGQTLQPDPGLQPTLPLSDSTYLLYVPDQGPMLVHAGTGEWLWWPELGGGPSLLGVGFVSHAHMLLADTVVYVPIGNRLHALHVRDGRPWWNEAPGFPGAIAQVELTDRGLLVRGERAWLRLVDPATGVPRWTKRFRELGIADRGDITPFLVADGRVYVVVDQKLRVLTLDDGAMLEYPAQFEGGDRPYHLERRGNGLLLVGRQNLMLLDSTGMQRYHAYHPAPGRSTLAKVGLTVGLIVGLTVTAFLSFFDEVIAEVTGTEPLFDQWPWDQVTYQVTYWNPSIGKRYAASAEARNYVYSVADVADSTGRQGPAFLKLHKDDGRVVGRVWLEEKRPDFQLDPVTGMLYTREGREILAFRM